MSTDPQAAETTVVGGLNQYDLVAWILERFDPLLAAQLDERLNAMTAAIAEVIGNQQQISNFLGAIMATLQQFEAALDRIDAATTDIAADLRDIRAKVAELEANAGIKASDEESVLARLDRAATTLEATAKDPENPVPEPEPNPPVE
jgi:septal ring factor EnvC (AmiA/AmiB activator)